MVCWGEGGWVVRGESSSYEVVMIEVRWRGGISGRGAFKSGV